MSYTTANSSQVAKRSYLNYFRNKKPPTSKKDNKKTGLLKRRSPQVALKEGRLQDPRIVIDSAIDKIAALKEAIRLSSDRTRKS